MKITKIETINFTRGIRVHAGAVSWLWIRLHSDEGLIGLGESYPAAEVAEPVLRTSLAQVLVGVTLAKSMDFGRICSWLWATTVGQELKCAP